MQSVAIDIWPYILSAVISAVGMYVGYIHQLKLEVAVLKKTLEEQQKTIDGMQKRIDSHSKKQDTILESINTFKIEMIEKIGDLAAELGSLSSDVKNINRAISIYDNKVSFNGQ